jgi:glyoxylase I family protein
VLETESSVLLNAHGTLFGLLGPAPETSAQDRSDPFRVGLDHLALAVDNAASLHELKRQLDAAAVRNNGVEDDALTGAKYIAFYDPDGIAWELYAMPISSRHDQPEDHSTHHYLERRHPCR